MKKLLIISLASLTLLTTSCSTYNAPTRYQGRNLYKFSKKTKTQHASKKARKHKVIAFKKRGSYWHGSVPKFVRKELRQRHWSEVNGGGQQYK